LYEAPKKDLSENSARMIAEVVPSAGDLATKSDIARLEARISDFELRIERRFSSFERRVLGWSLTLVVPLWAALVAALVKIVLKI
jgi:hypothetical protein